MRHVRVSLPTAVSGVMRLFIAYVLVSEKPDYILLLGCFFLTLSIYSMDRAKDYECSLKQPVLFS